MNGIIENVKFRQSIKFLGVILDDELSWKKHINLIQRKCSQRIYILRRIKQTVNNEEFVIVHNGLIRSLMEYACPAFVGLSSEDAACLENLQKRCLRIKGLVPLVKISSRRDAQ